MVGREKKIFERYREVLRSFGKQIFYVGEHGAGHLTKVINNLLAATTLASVAEAVLLRVRSGLDPEVLIEVINASSGGAILPRSTSRITYSTARSMMGSALPDEPGLEDSS